MSMKSPADSPAESSAAGSAFSKPVRLIKGKLHWIVRETIVSPQLEALLADPDAFLQDRSLLIADSPLITLAKVPPLTAGQPALVLRRLNYGLPLHRLRDVFRPTRAERAFWNGLLLEHSGVLTPRNIAVGVERFLRWPRRAYLLTDWVAGAIPLKELLASSAGKLPHELVLRLADLLAALHQSGCSHRDLKSTNVLFDEQMQAYLIDLDGVRHYGKLSQDRAVADLARFAWEFVGYPRLMKWNTRRFLKRYCARRGLETAILPLEREIARPIARRLSAGIRKWK